MKDYIKAIIFWLIAVGLYLPALATTYLGTLNLGFWDFYESTFMVVTMIAFIPMYLAAAFFRGPILWQTTFSVTAAWSMIFAIPDVFLSYFPIKLLGQVGLGFMGDYNGFWFGDTSFIFLLINILATSQLVLFGIKRDGLTQKGPIRNMFGNAH